MSGRGVIVIGGGANGLAAATLLARAGLPVTLLERHDRVGGRARTIEFAPGFHAAPLALDSGWVPDPVARALGIGAPARALESAPLRVAIEPGRRLTIPAAPAAGAEAIRGHSAADAAKWPAFATRMRALAGFLEALYLAPAPDISASSPRELWPLLDLGRRYRSLGRENMVEFLRTPPLSVMELLDDTFESAPLKAAVATGGILDHAQGPRSGGTGFVLLHHLVGAPAGALRGRPAFREGPGAFARAAEGAARAAGVSIRCGAAVSAIDVANDAVSGVVLERGERLPARAVLSTASPATTLLEWVDPVWLDPEFIHAALNLRHRGCTAYMLCALDALPDVRDGDPAQALTGVLSLSPDLRTLELAADAAKYGAMSEVPHVELCVPSLHWPALAPAGKHVLVARVQYAPYRLKPGDAWDAARAAALTERVTRRIEEMLPGTTARIRHQVVWTPHDLERTFGLRDGASSQGELGLDQILFMRPLAGWGGHGTPIGGLYLGGSGSHPGPGILGGAGWLAARRMIAELRKG